MRRGAWVILILSAFTITMAGCWNPFSPDKGGNGNGGQTYSRESPDELLEFFADAYERKDLDDYGVSLDDSFEFQFTDEDAIKMGLPPEKPWWGKSEDLTSTDNMFDSPEVKTIEMDFSNKTPWQACSIEITIGERDTTVDGLRSRLDPDIKVTTEQPGEEPLTYWVHQSWLSTTVIEDRYNPDLWTIVRIEEIKKPE